MHDLLVSISKAYDLSMIGYTEEDKQGLLSLQSEILSRIDARNYSELIRNWIRAIDHSCKLTVYNMEPQFHMDYMFADLLGNLKKFEITKN
jgi:hypothetical protein